MGAGRTAGPEGQVRRGRSSPPETVGRPEKVARGMLFEEASERHGLRAAEQGEIDEEKGGSCLNPVA